ncbi:thiamine ABC transporter ATP-binding protein [Kiloniella laminariae]|uniref:Thiamine ABC transporter ATP-binding protein n=1 Tax=Kiloniella laminariae TaxID=454162 RepID=A0ABT4LJQ4_9PROT|nr:thiamine ABC transporter ATP-binding protein [Kiloniella laminariae]MCZ4281332.1 thiamine ABC transporter ATP-binding protein [Kiloniella laminariae]
MGSEHKALPSQSVSRSGLILDQIRFSYNNSNSPLTFNLAINPGELVAITGPSGVGKSTLLNLISGFETPLAGKLSFNGEDLLSLPPARRPVTTLFQEHNLFAHLTVEQNIGLGLHPGLRLSPKDHKEIQTALASISLEGLNKRFPAELSGGQRQRVALARCLVRHRPILLLDEPFSALDPALREEMLSLVRSLHKENSLLTLMVTHLPSDAEKIADRVIQL